MIKVSAVWVRLSFALLAAALPACGSSDGAPGAVSDCKRAAASQCKKIYLCDSAAQRADLQGIGTTESECESAAIKECTADYQPCGTNETFDSSQADKCLTAFDAQTCSQFLAGNDVPACETVCGSRDDTTTPTSPAGAGGAASSSDNGDVSGTDAVSECKRAHLIDCQKIFACTSADQLAAEADIIGSSVSECADKLEASSPCDTDAACRTGTTYHADKADACVDGIGALTCDEFLNLGGTTAEPASCSLVCQ